MLRQRIYEIIEVSEDNDKLSSIYDIIMMISIIISIIPLCTHENYFAFGIIDKVTVIIFIGDYILRILTADKKLRRGALSFFCIPLRQWH